MKTRLHERGRNALRQLARELVACPVEQKAADAAYASASVVVRKMIETRFPPRDMAVLKKYDVARADPCIRLSLTPGGYVFWNLRSTDKIPLQPGHNCATHIADEVVSASVNASNKAADDLKKALETKLRDYYSLITAATNFEAVLEVWPEAEAARAACGASQIAIAVTDDVVARIRADIATRAIAA